MIVSTLLPSCGHEDHAPPAIVGATFASTQLEQPVVVSIADPALALESELVTVPTRGRVRLELSELIDGNAVEEVIKDPTGRVTAIIGREGVARLAPSDGSLVHATLAYRPEKMAIDVTTDDYLPAQMPILLHILAGRIWDHSGNIMPAAVDAFGKPVLDTDGLPVAATIAFRTEPIRVMDMVAPAYGRADDPNTPSVDEHVPYDAPLNISFNTAVAPSSAGGLITIVDDSGALISIAISAGTASTQLAISPNAPLTPNTHYELRIDPGIEDRFGVTLDGDPTLFEFETL